MHTIVASDLHIGPGHQHYTEEFFADAEFAAFLSHYDTGATRLVIAGDMFTLDYAPDRSAHPIAAASVQIRQAADGHRDLFDAIRSWLARGNSLSIIPGNHDFQLAYSEPQATLQGALPGVEFLHHHYYDPARRLYVEHGDYHILRRPGRLPVGYGRARHLLPHLIPIVPTITLAKRISYVSHFLAAQPLALFQAIPYIPRVYSVERMRIMPHPGDHVAETLIQAGQRRARRQYRRAMFYLTFAAALRLLAIILTPIGAALAYRSGLLDLASIALGALGVSIAANSVSQAATHAAEEIFTLHLSRAAAHDIAPLVGSVGARTIALGHSHIADYARIEQSPPVDYYNTGAWVYLVDPLATQPPPSQTYLHVDPAGQAQLFQWTPRGPREVRTRIAK